MKMSKRIRVTYKTKDGKNKMKSPKERLKEMKIEYEEALLDVDETRLEGEREGIEKTLEFVRKEIDALIKTWELSTVIGYQELIIDDLQELKQKLKDEK